MKDRSETTSPEAPAPAGSSGGSLADEISLPELTPRTRLVDVRAPIEFAEDHLPGAVSVPLLDDRERRVVGTLFRQRGPEPAREWGEARVSRRLEAFTRDLLHGLELPPAQSGSRATSSAPRVVYCSRGGERSNAVARHLRRLGHPVARLRGGYRAYRSLVRERLARCRPPGPVVLNGLTGCGKTRILREIARLRPGAVVDLEGLAGHRSSLFGDIGLEPVSQKAFESGLARSLADLVGPWSLFEWEARRIGNREVPKALYEHLRAAPMIQLTATIDQRVELLCDEYLRHDGIGAIRRRLPDLACYPAIGADGVRHLDALLEAGDVEEVAQQLLERHYDPRYRHGSAEFRHCHEVRFENVASTAAEILDWLDARHGKEPR